MSTKLKKKAQTAIALLRRYFEQDVVRLPLVQDIHNYNVELRQANAELKRENESLDRRLQIVAEQGDEHKSARSQLLVELEQERAKVRQLSSDLSISEERYAELEKSLEPPEYDDQDFLAKCKPARFLDSVRKEMRRSPPVHTILRDALPEKCDSKFFFGRDVLLFSLRKFIAFNKINPTQVGKFVVGMSMCGVHVGFIASKKLNPELSDEEKRRFVQFITPWIENYEAVDQLEKSMGE